MNARRRPTPDPPAPAAQSPCSGRGPSWPSVLRQPRDLRASPTSPEKDRQTGGLARIYGVADLRATSRSDPGLPPGDRAGRHPTQLLPRDLAVRPGPVGARRASCSPSSRPSRGPPAAGASTCGSSAPWFLAEGNPVGPVPHLPVPFLALSAPGHAGGHRLQALGPDRHVRPSSTASLLLGGGAGRAHHLARRVGRGRAVLHRHRRARPDQRLPPRPGGGTRSAAWVVPAPGHALTLPCPRTGRGMPGGDHPAYPASLCGLRVVAQSERRALTTSTSRSATAWACSCSPASTMTRTTGSVPDLRSSTRPLPASASSSA